MVVREAFTVAMNVLTGDVAISEARKHNDNCVIKTSADVQ
jgi:hypothetical protein